jgi:pimeloyl-ACP methyl ester carboxylesterase
MADPIPTVLIPGLICSARLYAGQISALWRFGPVTVADHTRDDAMGAIARRILGAAPPRFALVGLSMGGYLAFEIMRRQPERVAGLALLDTSARPDRPEQSAQRDTRIAAAEAGRFAEVVDELYPSWVHPARVEDAALREEVRGMAQDVGAEAFVRQQRAIKGRADSRGALAAIRCPTFVLVGDSDAGTPPELAREIAAGIAGSRLVVVPDCGHLSTLERPQAVAAALVEWLDELAR